MASLMENLIEILNKESEGYEGLLETSREKTAVIIKGDLEALSLLTEEEQAKTNVIASLDKKRRELKKLYDADIRILTFNRIDMNGNEQISLVLVGNLRPVEQGNENILFPGQHHIDFRTAFIDFFSYFFGNFQYQVLLPSQFIFADRTRIFSSVTGIQNDGFNLQGNRVCRPHRDEKAQREEQTSEKNTILHSKMQQECPPGHPKFCI